MKVKNIAFYGVMSAILISTGASAATTTKIASQKYVDDKAAQTLTTVSNTYATQDSVTNINNVLNNAETGLVGKITAAQSAADAAKNAADAAQADATKNAGDITALGTRVTKNETDIKSLTDGIDKTVADSIAGALTGEGAIKDAIDSAIEGAVGNLPIGTLTTDVNNLKTTVGDENSGLVKSVNDNATAIGTNSSAIETLNGNAETAGSVANTVNKMAIPRPDDNCSSESGRCVLSVSTEGSLMWLDVTAPTE